MAESGGPAASLHASPSSILRQTGDPSQDYRRQAYRWKVIVATSAANVLEWFDFVAFGFLAVTMAKLFFPASNDTAALLATFATFGIPFAVRPIGAIVLGAYADRRGRKAALMVSIGLMTLGTVIMAAAPTYQSIGAWAAVIVLVARMLQGFSVGGEYGAAVAFLVEQDARQRGFLASWHYASQSMTAVLATSFAIMLSNMLTPEQTESWGWRMPFIFGLLIAPLGLYVRSQLRETDPFMGAARSRAPAREVVARHGSRVVLAAGVITVSAVTIYTLVFMPTFAIKQLGLPPSVAFLGSLLAGSIQVILIPVAGLLSDRIDRQLLALAAALAVLLLAYPVFAFLLAVPTLSTLLIVQGVLGVLNAIAFGCLGALIADLFPTALRTSGLSLSNALTQMTLGGTTPFIMLWLIEATGRADAPAFYLMFAAALSSAALLAIRRARSGTAMAV